MIKWQLVDDLSEAFGPTEVSLDVSKPKDRAQPVVRASESSRVEQVQRALKHAYGMFGHLLDSHPSASELNAALHKSKELSEYSVKLIEGAEIVSADAAIARAEVAEIERAGGVH